MFVELLNNISFFTYRGKGGTLRPKETWPAGMPKELVLVNLYLRRVP